MGDDSLPEDPDSDPVAIRNYILQKLKNQIAAVELGQVYCGDFQLSITDGKYELNFPPVPESRREEMLKIGKEIYRQLGGT